MSRSLEEIAGRTDGRNLRDGRPEVRTDGRKYGRTAGSTDGRPEVRTDGRTNPISMDPCR